MEETEAQFRDTITTKDEEITPKHDGDQSSPEAKEKVEQEPNDSEYETLDESDEDVNDKNQSDSRDLESQYESEADVNDKKQSDSRDSESGVQDHSGSESEGGVVLEREEGDGQESIPPKKVDDDEDKKNPQYIPKRGTFYEHDDRTADDVETEPAEPEKDAKKKVWQDKKEKWSHDRFNDAEQAPKSRAELIAIYGYDIRNEDGPPRARRRRRYGRGPNKYTRNWEDEDAYNKPPPVVRPKKTTPRKPKSDNEEFPALNENRVRRDSKEVSDQNRSPVRHQAQEERVGPSRQDGRTSDITANITKQDTNRNQQASIAQEKPVNKQQPRVGTGRIVKPKKEIKDSDYRGFTKTRQFKSSKVEQKVQPRKPKKDDVDYIQTQNFTNKQNMQILENDMNKLSMQDAMHRGGVKHASQRQGSVPPRLQAEQKGSKRYSSLRQRSLPETTAPPFNQHAPGYYAAEYNQQPQQTQQQGLIHQNAPIHVATTQVPQIPPPPIPVPQQVPAVSATSILQAPPQFAPPFPQPTAAFLQPNVAPPAFLPQQTPPIINYVQSQPQFAQPAYQSYQQPYTPVTDFQSQPTELYQPQGGITYYSAQEQQVAQRAAPQKRPKAAIPIVPPPPEPRGRGRGLTQSDPPPIGEEIESKTFENSNKQFEDAAVAVSE